MVIDVKSLITDDKVLRIWTVYDHPTDYPDCYVARLHEVRVTGSQPTGSFMVCQDLEMLRSILCFEMHLTCLARSPEDEPQIVENWL